MSGKKTYKLNKNLELEDEPKELKDDLPFDTYREIYAFWTAGMLTLIVVISVLYFIRGG